MSREGNAKLSRRTLTKGSLAGAIGMATLRSGSIGASARQSNEISIMNWDVVPGTPLETALNAFQEESGISVDVQPAPTQDYTTRMRTLLASGATTRHHADRRRPGARLRRSQPAD